MLFSTPTLSQTRPQSAEHATAAAALISRHGSGPVNQLQVGVFDGRGQGSSGRSRATVGNIIITELSYSFNTLSESHVIRKV